MSYDVLNHFGGDGSMTTSNSNFSNSSSSSNFVDPSVLVGFRATSFVSAFVYLGFLVAIIIRMIKVPELRQFCTFIRSAAVMLIPLSVGFFCLLILFNFSPVLFCLCSFFFFVLLPPLITVKFLFFLLCGSLSDGYTLFIDSHSSFFILHSIGFLFLLVGCTIPSLFVVRYWNGSIQPMVLILTIVIIVQCVVEIVFLFLFPLVKERGVEVAHDIWLIFCNSSWSILSTWYALRAGFEALPRGITRVTRRAKPYTGRISYGCKFFYWEQIVFASINLSGLKADERNYSWIIIVPLIFECASCTLLLLFKQRVGLGKGLDHEPRDINHPDEDERMPPPDPESNKREDDPTNNDNPES